MEISMSIIEQKRHTLSLLVQERLELGRRGFFKDSVAIAFDCWRIGGEIERLERGQTPAVL